MWTCCWLADRLKGRQAWALATDKRTDVWSQDFILWKINSGLWAVVWAGLWNKRVWADYEQLLRPVFSLFRGQKILKKSFWKHYSVRTEKLHNTFFHNFFLYFLKPKKVKKIGFLGLKFEWNRLLMAILRFFYSVTSLLEHSQQNIDICLTLSYNAICLFIC